MWFAAAECSLLNGSCTRLLCFILGLTADADSNEPMRALLQWKISQEAWLKQDTKGYNVLFQLCMPPDEPGFRRVGRHWNEKTEILFTLMASDAVPKDAWFVTCKDVNGCWALRDKDGSTALHLLGWNSDKCPLLSEEVSHIIDEGLKTELAQGVWQVYKDDQV